MLKLQQTYGTSVQHENIYDLIHYILANIVGDLSSFVCMETYCRD